MSSHIHDAGGQYVIGVKNAIENGDATYVEMRMFLVEVTKLGSILSKDGIKTWKWKWNDYRVLRQDGMGWDARDPLGLVSVGSQSYYVNMDLSRSITPTPGSLKQSNQYR